MRVPYGWLPAGDAAALLSLQLPAKARGKAAGHGQVFGPLHPWLQPGPALVAVAIWGLNQQKEKVGLREGSLWPSLRGT